MLISCPACDTSFSIPTNALGESGRKVKCSKCAHVWHQQPVEFSKDKLDKLLDTKVQEKQVSDAPKSVNLPVKVSKTMIYSLAASFAVFFVLSVLFIYLNSSSAVPDYKGLRFSNFTVDSEIIDNKYDFYLKGELLNVTGNEIAVPEINIKVLSKGGRIMTEANIQPDVKVVPPYSRVEFSPDITQVSGNADTIELSFANWAERIFE